MTSKDEPQKFSYFDKSTGSRRSFEPSPDKSVARFPETAPAQAIPVAMAEKISPSGRVAIIRVPDAGLAEAAAELMSGADQMPVFRDHEGNERFFVPGEITVQFAEEVPAEHAEGIISELGGTVLRKHQKPGYYTVALERERDVFASLDAFSSRQEVSFAEPNEIGIDDALNVGTLDAALTLAEKLWQLKNTGQTIKGRTGVPGADVRAEGAWKVTRGANQVVVAVIDTGCDLGHANLKDGLLARPPGEDWNFREDAAVDPTPSNGHGTHVAGIVCAQGRQDGILGLAADCRVMPLAVDLSAGELANRASAIDFVVRRAASDQTRRYVINLSWKISGDHAGIRTAIARAIDAGIPVIVAAGNDSVEIGPGVRNWLPAMYPSVISVGATDNTDAKGGISNYGSGITVCAPGIDIYSTIPGGAHDFKSGTSMASPQVAALAALILSIAPRATLDRIRRALTETADGLDARNPGLKGKLGTGRINAERCLASIGTS
jgi:subtilisin family serine protease